MWLPIYLLLIPGLVAVFVVPGLVWKYPVVMSYLWAPHIYGLLLLRNRTPKPFVGILSMTVSRAHGLRPADYSNNDPYVQVRVGTQVKKTCSKSNTKAPVWNDEMEFVVFSPEVPVQIYLYDKVPVLPRPQPHHCIY